MTFGQNAVSRPERYEDQHLEVDFKTSSAWLDSHPIILTRKEYALLSLLVQNASEIVPRDALLRRIWGYSAQIRTRTLDVHIRRLRRKLGNCSYRYIETIFGSGYRFQPFRPEPSLRDYYASPSDSVTRQTRAYVEYVE